jgi:hypothetical protein
VQYSKEQLANLKKAIVEFRKSEMRLETANKDVVEKLNKLKTCTGVSGTGGEVMSSALSALGEVYLTQEEQD